MIYSNMLFHVFDYKHFKGFSTLSALCHDGFDFVKKKGEGGGSLAASLPEAWCYGISARTGWLGVNILCLDRMASLICNISVEQQV